MFVFKILIIFIFGFIFWQDFEDRLVFWFLYPIVGIIGFLIQIALLPISILLINTLINLVLILTISLILFVYTKIILKKKFVDESIGIGDLLFFVFLCFCFSSISFIVLFVFSLLFSLLLHFIFKNKYTVKENLPLAGYMSLFFAIVYAFSLLNYSNIMFAY